MHALNSYDYALIRVVPRVERGECINVGILLFCSTLRFLDIRVHLDPARLHALAPNADIGTIQEQLEDIVRICNGGRKAGTLGYMSQSERFHWLVAPRSTIIQTSPVHTGLCTDPAASLEHLLATMVYS